MPQRKTSKQQALRRKEGNLVEIIVRDELKKKYPKTYRFTINSHEGIDIYITNKKILNVEVKSVREKIFEGARMRSGRFYIKKEDYLTSDYFAFAIKPIKITKNKNARWDKRKGLKIMYVDTKIIQDYLKRRGLFKKGRAVKIGIGTIKSMKKKFPTKTITPKQMEKYL